MRTDSELDCYLYWMWNVWSYDTCKRVCEDTHLSAHYLWDKWKEAQIKTDTESTPASFYACLDDATRYMLVKAAVKYYNKDK